MLEQIELSKHKIKFLILQMFKPPQQQNGKII